MNCSSGKAAWSLGGTLGVYCGCLVKRLSSEENIIGLPKVQGPTGSIRNWVLLILSYHVVVGFFLLERRRIPGAK